MAVRGFVRTMVAAQRRAEREAHRRQRELLRQQKEYDKMMALERAQYEVEVYENTIDLLTSIHKDCAGDWDWGQIANTSPPEKSLKSNTHENRATEALSNYKPSIFDKIFNNVENKTAKFKDKIEEARRQDAGDYKIEMAKYEKDHKEWESIVRIGKGILNGDIKMHIEAIKLSNPFDDIELLGSTINFKPIDSSKMCVTFNANDTDVIPKTKKSLTKTGKLSSRDMPVGQMNQLYQDYVCGSALRIGRELFSLLPLNLIIVTVLGSILNSATGYVENKPILSVGLIRDTLESLNFDAVDPSDSMKNFKHNMVFKKMAGFAAVNAMDVSDFSFRN